MASNSDIHLSLCILGAGTKDVHLCWVATPASTVMEAAADTVQSSLYRPVIILEPFSLNSEQAQGWHFSSLCLRPEAVAGSSVAQRLGSSLHWGRTHPNDTEAETWKDTLDKAEIEENLKNVLGGTWLLKEQAGKRKLLEWPGGVLLRRKHDLRIQDLFCPRKFYLGMVWSFSSDFWSL